MKIDPTVSGSLPQLSATRQQNHQVQDVFSEVLKAADRRGYASAQESESSLPLDERIESSWTEWFDIERTGRYAMTEQPEQLKQGFGEILSRANAEGGYVAPKTFLNGLSQDELRVVQNVHSLADPIGVDSLSEEGALNLLLPPAAQVDLNGDGLTQSGAAYGLRFPDSNTPIGVVKAWEEATAEMSLGERMIYEFQMVSPILMANIHLDENGAYSHHFEPGDPEFVNPLAEPGYSYVRATQDRLDHLEVTKNWISQEQYERQTEFWSRFQNSLTQNGAR